MSKMHSATSPASLRGAGDVAALDVQLAEAMALFARQGLFGLTWLDQDLVARTSYGRLADFVPLGERITETVAPLIGLDETLLALKDTPEAPFQMPNIALVGPGGSSPRLSLLVYWLPDSEGYLLLVSNVLSTGELEIGLAQQVRKRMLAETELAQKSKALELANEELTRANRDLAEFAYVISHDLKAPLRAMRYFVDDLDRALAGDTQGDPRPHAAQIRAQSQRMSQMLSDLLAYSRIGRKTEAVEPVDTAALVRSIVGSIPRPRDMRVEISGSWPAIETCAAPLDLVLRNLIGNAIAHHDREDGLVRVICQVQEHALEIEIADDGPGIPIEWHEAVFMPFRTMSDSGEGSGIGLALVRRTIESVGALLNLVSDPETARGASFKIIWPFILNY